MKTLVRKNITNGCTKPNIYIICIEIGTWDAFLLTESVWEFLRFERYKMSEINHGRNLNVAVNVRVLIAFGSLLNRSFWCISAIDVHVPTIYQHGRKKSFFLRRGRNWYEIITKRILKKHVCLFLVFVVIFMIRKPHEKWFKLHCINMTLKHEMTQKCK